MGSMYVLVRFITYLDKNFLKVTPAIQVKCAGYARLLEIGRLDTPKLTGTYDTGQLFLHKVFGYRGIIMFPWLARVYDREITNVKSMSAEPEQQPPGKGKEVKSKTRTFYQVFMDVRDSPFIRVQPETWALIFLGNKDDCSPSLYSMPGLDYVAHEEILPYTSREERPLQHELFAKFFVYQQDKDPPYVAQDALSAWQRKNHTWLQLSDVHMETTENVRVTVMPFYIGCRASSLHWWRYCIRLENLGEASVQLRERHWRIFSQSGTLETVRGRGVAGREPVLSAALPAYQYTSHVSLLAPVGHMWGTFLMEREDGYTFDCRVPPFQLDSKMG